MKDSNIKPGQAGSTHHKGAWCLTRGQTDSITPYRATHGVCLGYKIRAPKPCAHCIAGGFCWITASPSSSTGAVPWAPPCSARRQCPVQPSPARLRFMLCRWSWCQPYLAAGFRLQLASWAQAPSYTDFFPRQGCLQQVKTIKVGCRLTVIGEGNGDMKQPVSDLKDTINKQQQQTKRQQNLKILSIRW